MNTTVIESARGKAAFLAGRPDGIMLTIHSAAMQDMAGVVLAAIALVAPSLCKPRWWEEPSGDCFVCGAIEANGDGHRDGCAALALNDAILLLGGDE